MTSKRDEHISRLLLKCITGILTEEERLELDSWRKESAGCEELYSRLTDLKYIEKEYRRRKAVNTKRALADMQRRIESERPAGRMPALRRWAVAASIVILASIGILLWNSRSGSGLQEGITAEVLSDSIMPGTMKAVLTLPDGQRLSLGADEAQNLTAMEENGILAGAGTGRQLTLDVPRGGEFKIVLEDSTEVWLNAGSRLIYPETFAEDERRVCVTGEAYFHVTKDSDRPFFVETDGQQVRVYGTEFNVRSYEEDAKVRTTLVKGSISLSKAGGKSGELMLTPGHQAMFDKQAATTNVKSVDTSVVTSWKNGRFVFEDQSLEQIMRELGRWYDFEYEFADDSLRGIEFMGSVSRYADFNTTLALIEKSGGIKFSVSGEKVRVLKK